MFRLSSFENKNCVAGNTQHVSLLSLQIMMISRDTSSKLSLKYCGNIFLFQSLPNTVVVGCEC